MASKIDLLKLLKAEESNPWAGLLLPQSLIQEENPYAGLLRQASPAEEIPSELSLDETIPSTQGELARMPASPEARDLVGAKHLSGSNTAITPPKAPNQELSLGDDKLSLEDEILAEVGAANSVPGTQLPSEGVDTPKSFLDKLNDYSKKLEKADLSPWAALIDAQASRSGDKTGFADIEKAHLDEKTTEAALLKQQSQDERQNKYLQSAASRDYINQVEKDIKPLKEIISASSAVRKNLTPVNGKVSLGKAFNVVAFAARALGNVGVHSENDAARTLLPTLETKLSQWQAILKSEPNKELDYSQVSYLLESINNVAEATRQEVSDKIAVTQDAYVVGRDVPAEKAAAVLAPYKKYLETKKREFVSPTLEEANPIKKSASDLEKSLDAELKKYNKPKSN